MTAHTLIRRLLTGAPVAALATLAQAAESPKIAVAQDRCQAERSRTEEAGRYARVYSVRRVQDDAVILERARLADGRRAFTERGVRHMADVRTVVGRFLSAWAVALVAATAAVLAPRRGATARQLARCCAART